MGDKDFTQMSVWRLALNLLLKVYGITKSFPSDERYGLVSDMRRAANSVKHNIAEGYGRFEPRDKTRFYKTSRASCFEIMSQLYASYELKYLKTADIFHDLIGDCKRIINELAPLTKTLENRTQK